MPITLSTFGAGAALAAALFFAYSNRKNKAVKPPKTTQDLIRYKDITSNGIVELKNHQYRLVIEVEPVNMMLKSQSEQELLWVGFRDMVNALTLSTTFLVQTRHLDLKDYISELSTSTQKAATPELKAFGDKLCEFLANKTENNVRDRRHYIILKIDALAASSIDSGIKIDNEALNNLLSDLVSKKNKNMGEDEIRSLAHQELDNMSGIIQSCLNQMEIPSYRLNREGVLDLIYSTFNREMAPHARVTEAGAQEMFSLGTISLTPYLTGVARSENQKSVQPHKTEQAKETGQGSA